MEQGGPETYNQGSESGKSAAVNENLNRQTIRLNQDKKVKNNTNQKMYKMS